MVHTVEILNVTKTFNSHRAVDDITLDVPKGCVYGFIGPNGSGKTTTLRMIMNIIYPDSGTIRIFGAERIEAATDRIGYLPEERGLYKKMKVGEQALYLARLRPHYQDLDDPTTDTRCLLCHVTGSQDDEALFEPSYRPQEGVSCEACHGPGSNYATTEAMTDREAFLDAGGQIPDEATCGTCHRNSENFDWDEMWPEIAHPKTASASDG